MSLQENKVRLMCLLTYTYSAYSLIIEITILNVGLPTCLSTYMHASNCNENDKYFMNDFLKG